MGIGDISYARNWSAPPLEVQGTDPKRPEPIVRPNKGVVLAAGSGTRLSRYSRTPKMLQPLLGVPLVERAVHTLLRAGLDTVIVVYGAHPEVGEYCRRVFGGTDGELGRVKVVYAPRWQEGNGASLTAVAPFIKPGERFVSISGDHYTPVRCIEALLEGRAPSILVDSSVPEGVDVEEATKVLCDAEGRVIRVGKQLEGVDCFRLYLDAGAHLLTSQVFAYLDSMATGVQSEVTVSSALEAMAQDVPLYVVEVPKGCTWQDIDTPQDLAWARRKALKELRGTKDGIIARYINRPLSLAITAGIARFRPSANAISTFALFLALVASLTASLSEISPLLVAILIQLVSVIDGVDGEIARATFSESRFGRLLDGVFDRIGDTAILTGVALRSLAYGTRVQYVILLLGISVASSLLSMSSKDRLELVAPLEVRSYIERSERLIGNLLAGRDGRLLILAVFMALGKPTLALGIVGLVATTGLVIRLSAAYKLVRLGSNFG